MKFARIRTLNWVAALVLVHQLGACTCGCADHNAWIQATMWCLGGGAESSHRGHHHEDESAGLVLHDTGHCEGERPPVEYLRHGSDGSGAVHAACVVPSGWQSLAIAANLEAAFPVWQVPPLTPFRRSAPLVLRI